MAALGLLAVPSAHAATKQVEIPASLIFTTPNDGPYKCAAKVYVQFQAWDTESKWEIHYRYQGSPRVKTVSSPSGLDSDPDSSPPEGYHWVFITASSKDRSFVMEPANCSDFSALQKERYTDPRVFITVDEKDPGPDEDDPPPPPPPPPPPTKEELKPPVVPPPPVENWPFDPRRSTVTLVDCEPGAKASQPYACTVAVWDAHPDDADASAPTGDVNWFAPTGKLGSNSRCTLTETTAAASICTVNYRPSSKTHNDPKQPVQGGYQGSKIHRPSGGLDGVRPIPVPTDWKATKRKVGVSLYCGGGKTCKGNAILTAKAPSGSNARSSKRRTRKIGSSRYRIRSGTTKRVTIKLSRKGRKMVRRSKRRLRAKLVLAPSGAGKLSYKTAVKLTK